MSIATCQSMTFTQFELSKITMKNLHRFNVSPTGKLVLLALIDCYNPANKEIFPKQSTLAEQLGISISSVKRVIKELAEANIIMYEVVKQSSRTPETSFYSKPVCVNRNINRYRLTPTFFALINLIPETAQNKSSAGINLRPSCHEQIKEHKKNKVLNFQNAAYERRSPAFSNRNGYNCQSEPKTISIETTRKMLEEKSRIQPKSPMDDRETAVKWLAELTENELKHSFIKERVEKIKSLWKL